MNYIHRLEKAVKLYIQKLILPSEPLCPLWNRENFIFRKKPKWNYIDSCMITAVLRLYEYSGDRNLLDFAVSFTSAYVDENGDIPTMNREDFNLDNINGGKNLLSLYRISGNERWLKAAQNLADALSQQPRLDCGSFWHKAIYQRQIWLDGSYMAFPFMAEFAGISGNTALIDDIRCQLRNIRNLMHDSESGLYYHGYDETKSINWADPETGLSHEFWLRSMGWLCAALADLCEILTDEKEISEMLAGLLDALSRHATPDGMLLQLPAHPELSGNYPETSGTLLFAYSALKAHRLGKAGEALKSAGEKALSAVTEKYLVVEEDDTPVLKNICLMAGLGINRSGTAEYYLSEPVTENDAKGIAPLIMAYTELMKGNSLNE
ncbi:MAG: glycoside hydrolase family 88 protein [Ruminococcus sp.]|nr:glycoside hydrolase family 88 protein [Ruminococcus sp.]